MAEDDDAFSGELFTDWLGDISPGGGTVSSEIGKLRYREGGKGDDWATPGGTKYLPHAWHMQCGAFKDTFTARSSGGFTITFPVAFGDNPIIIASVCYTWPLFEDSRIQTSIVDPGQFDVYWWSTNNLTQLWVNWLAMGPIGI